MFKVLTEASGSLVSTYLLRAIQQAGFIAVGSDITDQCAAKYIADDFIIMPSKNDPNLWTTILNNCLEHQIDMVIPSFDETLLGWSQRKVEFSGNGINVLISDAATLEICQDKWKTYLFFERNGIPTPKTSLSQIYPLVKPREGRGGQGIRVEEQEIDMNGLISQELVSGEEVTIDIFCDKDSTPVYIVPRKRMLVKDGKSTAGIVIQNKKIEEEVRKICGKLPFYGPINIQCFLCDDGSIKFIEINPRIAGGMALGFAATENWVSLAVEHFIRGGAISPKKVQYGMRMMRYYHELFIAEGKS